MPFPELLDVAHLLADGGGHAGLVLEVASRREVVGMRMRVEDPLEGEALALDVGEQLVGGVRRRSTRLRIEVEHRVDDRGAASSPDQRRRTGRWRCASRRSPSRSGRPRGGDDCDGHGCSLLMRLRTQAVNRDEAARDDVDPDDDDEAGEDGTERLPARCQDLAERGPGEPAEQAADDEQAGEPPVDEAGDRVAGGRGRSEGRRRRRARCRWRR